MGLVDWILRILQFSFTILSLALACTLVNQQALGGSPTRINFAIFATVFALCSLFYLIPGLFYSPLAFPPIVIAIDLLNSIFFLSAAIAVAAQLSGASCGNRWHLFNNELAYGGGYSDPERRCREAQALTAFLWFGFAVWAAQTVLGLFRWLKEREEARVYGGRTPSRVGLRRTEPGVGMREAGGV